MRLFLLNFTPYLENGKYVCLGWGGGEGDGDCRVKNSIASSSNDTEHRTWCAGLLFTQYGEEVFHHIEHYRTLPSINQNCQGKNTTIMFILRA